MKTYRKTEKTKILRELRIAPIDGLVNSTEAAKIFSQRAKIEVGEEHEFDGNYIRALVKTGKLPIAREIHSRLNLFRVDDLFAIELYPQMWHNRRRSKDTQEKGVKG